MSRSAAPAERRLLSGSFWLGAAQAVSALSTLVSGLLVVRLLPQHDIGVMAIALLAARIVADLTYPGIEKALVQRREGVAEYLDAAWSIGLVRGLGLSAALALAAYPLSRWYGEPVLLWVLLVTAVVPLVGGLNGVGPIYFSRELDFRALFLLRSAQAASSLLIAIPAILVLRNVWALVLSHVGGALLGLLLSYAAHPHRPRFSWERDKVRELWSYGKWLTLTATLVFVVTQGDDVFVSKYFGPATLAVYQLAYDFGNVPTTHVTHVLAQSSFPVYARLQAQPEKLRETWLAVLRGVMLFSSALAALVAMLVPYLIEYVIGARWYEAIALIQILILAGFVRSFQALAGPMFQAVGRTDLDFKMNLPRFAVVVIGIWPACAYFGLAGACWVVVASIVASLPLWFSGVHATLGVRPGEVARATLLPLLSGGTLLGILAALRAALGTGPVGLLALPIGGIAIWLGALYALGRFDRRLDVFAELARLRQALRG